MEKHQAEPRPSLLPFDPADLVALRVLPAQFARMCAVSKQTVSQWIKRGTITLGPDGRVDPATASRQVIERTDPARLRARVFKQATATQGQLRQRIAELEASLASEHALCEQRLQAAQYCVQDEAAAGLDRFMDAVLTRFDEAIAVEIEGRLGEWLDDLAATTFYGFDLDECRAMPATDAGCGAGHG